MKQQAAEIVAAGGTLLRGPFRLAPDKKNPETFAMLFRSPGGYIFELFTLEEPSIAWIGFIAQEKINSHPFYVSRFMLHAL